MSAFNDPDTASGGHDERMADLAHEEAQNLPAISKVICPNCNAQLGQPCTMPTETGRRSVRFYHYAREELAYAARRGDLADKL